MTVLAVLHWMFLVALAALAATRLPQLPYAMLSGNSMMLWFLAVATSKFVEPSLVEFIDWIAPAFNWILPTGWPLLLVHALLPDRAWRLLLLLPPIGLILGTFLSSLPLLQGRFRLHEPVLASVPDQVPGDEDGENFRPLDPALTPPRPIGVTAIEEGILAGDFLAQVSWDHG